MSAPFAEWLAPQINAKFPDAPPIDAHTLFHSLNTVKTPSYIRVESDEQQYPVRWWLGSGERERRGGVKKHARPFSTHLSPQLHIILRFRLERALVAGTLAVDDLPSAWAEASNNLLGVTPPSAALGPLQDMHWAGFAIGYFPTYLCGALAAAQLWEAAVKALGGEAAVEADIKAGRFDRIRTWLTDNVHARGSQDASLDAWLTAITGAPLSVEPFLRRLKKKVVAVYQLSEGDVDAAMAPGVAAAAALGKGAVASA